MCVGQNLCDTRREICPLVETTALHMSLAYCCDIRWCLMWTEELWYTSSKLASIPNFISVPPSNTHVFRTDVSVSPATLKSFDNKQIISVGRLKWSVITNRGRSEKCYRTLIHYKWDVFWSWWWLDSVDSPWNRPAVSGRQQEKTQTSDCYRNVWPVPFEKHTESWSRTIASSLYRAGVSG